MDGLDLDPFPHVEVPWGEPVAGQGPAGPGVSRHDVGMASH